MENIKKNRNNDNKDIVNRKKENRGNVARKVIALMMCVLMILSLAACNFNDSGAYMDAKDNGDGTYTYTINNEKEVNGYTAETAPIVMPVDTPGYAAQEAVTEYSYDTVADYMEAGYIYVHVGARGRSMSMGGSGSSETTQSNDKSTAETGAPWVVTDFNKWIDDCCK